MDGLTISTSESLLKNGETVSQLRDSKMKLDSKDRLQTDGTSFADTLENAIGKVNELQKTADHMTQELATGKNKNIPEVMVAVEKADIALKLMVQVRNKIIDAYQEIMKMQV